MRIQKTLNHGNARWRASVSLEGKRKQRFFTSRDGARAWLNSIEADRTGFWHNRTPDEQRDIVSAFSLASKRGVPVYQMHAELPCQTHPPLHNQMPLGEYAEVIKQRSLRPSSLKQTQLHLSQLDRTVLQSDVPRGFTSAELEQWFHTRNWKRSTIDGVLRQDRAFLHLVHQCEKATARTTRARP